MQSLCPLNMYGYSKQMFDLWAERHGYLDRLIGLKYFNVFGPNEDHKGEMRSVVQKAFHQIQLRARCSYSAVTVPSLRTVASSAIFFT